MTWQCPYAAARAGKSESMNNRPLTPREIDEVLAGVHEEIELGATGARIHEIADQHLQAREAILAFAAEWFASPGSDLSDDDTADGHTLREHTAILDQFWQAAAADEAKPSDGQPIDKLDDVASRCRIDREILRKLVRGRIDEMSIPGRLVGWLGHELETSPAAVWAALSAADAGAHADYYAPSGPKPGRKASFADAIRKSDLDAGDKRFWLDQVDV